MKYLWLLAFLVPCAFIGCAPSESSQSSAYDAPAAYIPPPENGPEAPAADSGQWIGPQGYQGPASQ